MCNMGLFQQLASPSPFFFLQSEFPYTIKHTRKQCIHGLVLLRNLYGYSIYCFLHVAKHKTATNSQKTNEKRRRAGITRRIVSIHQTPESNSNRQCFVAYFSDAIFWISTRANFYQFPIATLIELSRNQLHLAIVMK